ncbi:hypothetical protein HYH02_009772 [Chlamydomonas schloesseri]|uniref:Plant heme peroxidase family profile domain-containing protein n=1 Tax=Chlamydomonas schloesseri TaxID=2026947 RepID=A0A835TK37_9CHLO|nr:hypothetical protein HYH02_009772 [Chlamydomonas schloesseri]|eukprot:KAG2441979.1 hypothetical protein HYH02_009772 [Chlamydomonas schloesseri]
MAQQRLRGWSLYALAVATLALLVASLLPGPCPLRATSAQLVSALTGIATTLLGGVSSTLATTLGLVDGTVTTVTGVVVDVTELLTRPVQCSGSYCVNLELYSDTHPDLADTNARVLLWSPKLINVTAGREYDPRTKDWVSVVATCRELFQYEKRMASFFIRSSFHDSMAVDVSQCPGPNCGGADASLLLSIEEMARPENAYDDFSLLAARAAKKIASFFDISVADTLAVCAAVAPEVLSKGRIKILTGSGPGVLRVGRLDSMMPSPPGNLPAATASVEEFAAFWSARGITAAEATALMGSHALIDTQACYNGRKINDYCNPATSDCSDVRMFRWENHYYKDICSPTLTITPLTPEDMAVDPAETPILGMTDPEMDAEAKQEMCKFTSNEGRAMAMNNLAQVRRGNRSEAVVPPEPVLVTWTNKNCRAGAAYGINVTEQCPHAHLWFYTTNDAYLGQACQGVGSTPEAIGVRSATRSFVKNQTAWDVTYRSGYLKMVTAFANWSPLANDTKPYSINGGECSSGIHLEAACAQATPGLASSDTKTLYAGSYSLLDALLGNSCGQCAQGVCPLPERCGQCTKAFNSRLLVPKNPLVTEANCCACSTLIRPMRYNSTKDASGNTYVTYSSFVTRWPDVVPTTQPAQPIPADQGGVVPPRPLDTTPFNDSAAPPASTSLATVGDAATVCPTANGIVKVRGFPSSFHRWVPFQQPYANPPRAQIAASYAKPGTNLTVDAYEIDIYTAAKDIGCPAGKPTWVLTYNGSVPGPSFRVLKGRQTLVRFNNRLTPANLTGTPFTEFHPCEGGRSGRPISVHLHGSASLAPYDGWAEDTTCGAETKDYYYPNWRGGFGWYHDHQLDITSENAYFGLSGLYTAVDRAADGGCGQPWNLDNIPEWDMQFKDAVLDSNCQLYYDRAGPHRNNLYGDINFVNGIPWPVATMEPRWQRFRWLVSSVARPYKLRLVFANGTDYSGNKCQVVGGEAGLRRSPVPFPAAGLFMGVAERYEVACDFRGLATQTGQVTTLYLVNVYDDRRMKDVPFFCHSHLVMKIDVACGSSGCTTSPAFQPPAPGVKIVTPIDRVLNQTDIDSALAMVSNKQCTRTFRFGRRHGHWVINGESWHTARIAAADVGHNTWEVWCLETGGGWFHPIHIHLVDFFVLARNWDVNQVHEYERFIGKDVVQLDPSAHIALLVRFGAHRGEYMFHCHNLMHEDFEMMRSLHVMPTPGSRTAGTALPMQLDQTIVTNLNYVYDLYADPVYPAAGPKPTSSLTPLRTPGAATTAALSMPIDRAIHRIYYPYGSTNITSGAGAKLADPVANPWLVPICKPQTAAP